MIRFFLMSLIKILLNSKVLFNFTSLFYKKIFRFEIRPLYDYVKDNKILKLIDDKCFFEYRCQAPSKDLYENWQYNIIEKREISKQYISIIENAIVRGDTDAIFVGGLCLTDKVLFDKSGFLQHPPYKFFSNGSYCIVVNTGKIRRIKKGISLVKMWSYNYFHFVFEGLSRIGEIDKLSDYKDWPIIIDECVKIDPKNIEIIDLINVNKRKIIWIKKGEFIYVDKLIQPPVLTWAVWDVPCSVSNAWGYMLDKKSGRFLRKSVLKNYIPKRKYNCVYVARGNNNRLINESSIIDYFSKHGFEIFYPDQVEHFEDEIDCFSTANCIVFCAGGASTNLVYCKALVDIYCFLPFEFRCDNPHDVTDTIGLSVHMIDGTIIQNGGYLMNSTFEIPIEKCRSIVNKCKRKGVL